MINSHTKTYSKAVRRYLKTVVLSSLLCIASANAETKNTSALPPIINYLLFSDQGPGNAMTVEEAARFLTQTTFGPRYEDIVELSNSSYTAWLNRQFSLPTTKMTNYVASQGWVTNHPLILSNATDSALLNIMLNGNDQLRQRVAYALSQIFVVSRQVSNGINERPLFYLDYYDLLAENAFGNYRELLEKVTLNDVMGFYLTMRLNAPANTQVGPVDNSAAFFVSSPDENYAREIMQLFSIGLVELNLDGTPKLLNGNVIPSYTQDTVENMARVFTGWNYKDIAAAQSVFFNLGIPGDTSPMLPFDAFHDKGTKKLLNNVTLPANQSARRDLTQALDNIFNHQNVAPFIGKHLIQHLVTSNPTPAYVARVARVFNNNGQGVRGDLKAVVLAVLLDDEARNGHRTLPEQFGKFKEPFIRQIALWRGMQARRRVNNRNLFNTNDAMFLDRLQQFPLKASSVFNFYQPDFSPPGIFREKNMVAPVAQLFDTQTLIGIASSYEEYVQRHHDDANNTFARDPAELLINTQSFQDLIPDDLSSVDDLIERLNLILMAGAMSDDMKAVLRSVHSSPSYIVTSKAQIVIDLLNIIVVSPQYSVQK